MSSRRNLRKNFLKKNTAKNIVFGLILFILFILPFLDGGTSFTARFLILSLPLPLLLLKRAVGDIETKVLPSKKIIYLGSAFLFFVFVSVMTSASLALSIPAFFQLLAFFMFFYLFWQSASQANLKKGIWAVLTASFLLCLLSFYYILPVVKEKPAGMNLVYATHGHSHLADWLILAIPLTLALFWEAKKKKIRSFLKGLLIFFLLSLVLTFSRGAFLVLPVISLFFIYFLKPKRADEKIISRLLIVVPLCFLFLIFSLSSFGTKLALPFSDNWLTRQLIKPSLQAKRFDYWQQALKGFFARPFFGFGWGTFKLVGLRFQRLPVSWSDYTHNFYLQVLAEAGIFAFFAFLGFLSISFQQIWSLVKKEKKELVFLGAFGAVLASSLHSFVDYDWSFPAVFLVFLFLVANLLSLASSSQSVNPPIGGQAGFHLKRWKKWLVIGGAALCFVFGQMQMMGEYFYRKKNFEKAFFFSPWREKLVIEGQEALLSKDFGSQEKIVRNLLFLYGDEPKMLSFLQERFYEREISEETTELYYRAIIASPLENFKPYPKLAGLYDKLKMEKEKTVLDDFFAQQLDQEREFYHNKPRFGKTFYLFGETYLGKKEEKAIPWWERAVEAGPEWSYFHIELASLYAKMGDLDKAEEVLTRCLNFRNSREHCQIVLEKFKIEKKLEEPRSFKTEIVEEIED